MRTATATQIKSTKQNFSGIGNRPAKESPNSFTSHLETAVKHYLLYNLDILLEVSKHEKIGGDMETAASVIRNYEFLSLVNNLNQDGL